MKLWAMPWRATQDRQVMVESSDKTWSTGEGMANHSSILASRIMDSMKRQYNMTLKGQRPGQWVSNTLWRKQKNSSRKNEEVGAKRKQCSVVMCQVVKVVWCCKEQYCIGNWNVRSTNLGKLDVVKQEMARVNINILGISELKWRAVGDFNSDDHCIYYCGQESLSRNGVALIVSKSLKCSTWVQYQKWQNDLGLSLRQTIQQHSNTSLCLNLMTKKLMVLWRLARPSRTNMLKRCLFHHRNLPPSPSTLLQMAKFFFFLWLRNTHIFFIHLSTGGRLGFFCILASVNNAAMNTGVCGLHLNKTIFKNSW